ncbi:unnamed protein product [Allacma fusca]|uniref:Uncharacterized protein n=1 Tax=Allacma fusca TaxID=39272 RepID=A0A8J2NV06_9HEXA|nr:unnamed protein product [Allacma fusca]
MISFHYFLIEILLIPFSFGGVNLSCTNKPTQLGLHRTATLKAIEQACTFGEANSTSGNMPFNRLVNLSKDDNSVNKHDFVQAMMIIKIGDVFQRTANNVCRLDAYRKEFADM